MKLNQKGASLIELIATLALVASVAVIAWTALTIGIQHNAIEMSKTQLQQETNLLITTMSNKHRKSDSYFLRTHNGQLQIKTCSSAECFENEFSNIIEKELIYCGIFNNRKIESDPQACNEIADSHGALDEIMGSEISQWSESCRIEPDKEHLAIEMIIADSKNFKNYISLNTTLTRVLTGEKEGEPEYEDCI